MPVVGDFIKIEYTGKDKNGKVFDSTSGEVAKALHGKEGPLLLIVGRDVLLPGLQDAIEQLNPGQETDVELTPEKAFGTRSRELIKVMAIKEFEQMDAMPQPGLQVEFETDQGKTVGTIRSVNSGRVLVDFNHPLADQTVRYHVKLVEVAPDDLRKVQFILGEMGLEAEVKKENDVVRIYLPGDSRFEEKKTQLSTTIRELLPEVVYLEIHEAHGAKDAARA